MVNAGHILCITLVLDGHAISKLWTTAATPKDKPETTRGRSDRSFASFRFPTPGNNQRRPLVSRHVDCRQGESARFISRDGQSRLGSALAEFYTR